MEPDWQSDKHWLKNDKYTFEFCFRPFIVGVISDTTHPLSLHFLNCEMGIIISTLQELRAFKVIAWGITTQISWHRIGVQ